MVGKISSLFVEVGSALSFETPELLKIAPEKLEQFYQEEPGLETYRRYFQIVQDQKEHILSDAEEKLLAAAGEMAQAPEDILRQAHQRRSDLSRHGGRPGQRRAPVRRLLRPHPDE